MMLGPRFIRSTKGVEISGVAPSLRARAWRPDVTSTRIGSQQWAHSLSMVAFNPLFHRFPSTKGAATASMPQAPKKRSPESSRTRWGVRSAVTG